MQPPWLWEKSELDESLLQTDVVRVKATLTGRKNYFANLKRRFVPSGTVSESANKLLLPASMTIPPSNKDVTGHKTPKSEYNESKK